MTLTIFVAGLSFDLWVGQWPHQICGLEGGKETCAPAIYIYIYIHTVYDCMIKGSLEVKLPTIWTDGKAEVVRVREEKRRREKIREEKEREERRCRCAKRSETCDSLCFSNDLWLRRVEK